MKKTIYGLISLCMVFTLVVTNVNSTNFEGKEDKYIKICSSTTLAKSKKSICKEFNTYLKNKNSKLRKEIVSDKNKVSETSDDIKEVESKINSLNTQISTKEKEINYLLSSIKKIKSNIEKKDNEMRDRLYAMQSDYNSNFFIQFLFGSENFSDFFSRVNSLNDVTAYENELIDELNSEKKELDKQKKTLVQAKANLQSQKQSAATLQKRLVALKKQLQKEITANQNKSKQLSAAQKEIDETLEEITRVVPQNDSGGNVIKGGQGKAEVGYKIAKAAVSKCGSPYYWGASGPNMFDCSGLVYWAHKAGGARIGRSTANSYAHSGKAISASQLQAGDIVAFRRRGSSRYHHIAIYIGGGIVVHASGEGSTCLGNHASRGHVVKRTPLSSFSRYAKAYRRLY